MPSLISKICGHRRDQADRCGWSSAGQLQVGKCHISAPPTSKGKCPRGPQRRRLRLSLRRRRRRLRLSLMIARCFQKSLSRMLHIKWWPHLPGSGNAGNVPRRRQRRRLRAYLAKIGVSYPLWQAAHWRQWFGMFRIFLPYHVHSFLCLKPRKITL